MLVLSREIEERVEITCGDTTITVVVCDVRKSNGIYKVRLGFDAPRDVSVHRSEVADAIRAKPVTRIAETEHD